MLIGDTNYASPLVNIFSYNLAKFIPMKKCICQKLRALKLMNSDVS